jgi:hypothetical protein
LCITSPSCNLVEAVATWGHDSATEKTSAPENCWALRHGRIRIVDDPDSPLRCSHANKSTRASHICVPSAAQGETLGVLYLECAQQSSNAMLGLPNLARQAIAAGECISLALANLRLREVLCSQSIRDPLTGLFNRRYMEESLEREITLPTNQGSIRCTCESFRTKGGNWQVSNSGGSYPIWSRSGCELFFRNPENRMIVAA